MADPVPSQRERQSATYLREHGQSPEAEAARVLYRFMCCEAGKNLVEYAILEPFGYTLDAGPVVRDLRVAEDTIKMLRLRIAELEGS